MAVAVGDVITAALYNDLETAATGATPHEEWTATSASVASATTASVGTLTRDAATSNATLATIATNALTVSASGLYDLTISGSIPVAPTGTFWVRVTDGTDLFYAFGTTVSTTLGNAMFAGLRIPAATTLTFTFYHVGAASRVFTSRVRLTKTGTY